MLRTEGQSEVAIKYTCSSPMQLALKKRKWQRGSVSFISKYMVNFIKSIWKTDRDKSGIQPGPIYLYYWEKHSWLWKKKHVNCVDSANLKQ